MGLEYLHGCKVIHRDLKGGNVLVTRNGRVKLADFGASKAYHEATITDGMKSIRGSIFWMAPEVIKVRCDRDFHQGSLSLTPIQATPHETIKC